VAEGKSKRGIAHVPTKETRFKVWIMAAAGHIQDRIAGVLQISHMTLRKHYRQELDFGMDEANANVATNLYRIAIGRTAQAAPAAMFWLKTRAGWRETSPAPPPGEGAAALALMPPININFGGPDDEDE
jgi:hypothetical protein